MILRRVVHRLKRQEWTAIAIELVLVVLGVFIGIQVSTWNEARKEHALEAVYLERIAVQVVPSYSDAAPNSPGIALFILSTLDGNRSAYETVINTGGITVMRDEKTLRNIQDYYASMDKALHFEVGLEQNRDKLIDAEQKVGVSPVDAMTVRELASVLAVSPELRATADNYWLYTNRHLKLMHDLQQEAKVLADGIQGREL